MRQMFQIFEGNNRNPQIVVFDYHTSRPAVLEFHARDLLEHFNAQWWQSHTHHRIVLVEKIVRCSRESKIANGLQNP